MDTIHATPRTSGPGAARSRLLAILLLLPLLSGCFPAGGDSGSSRQRDSSVKGASSSRKVSPSSRDAQEAFRLVNDERSKRGMQSLGRRADLDAVAYAHARDLVRMNKLNHISSDGRQLEHRLGKLEWELAGENLARNKGFDSPAREAVKGWINSPKHFENMFRPEFSQTGMAALYDSESGFTYFVQVFIVPIR